MKKIYLLSIIMTCMVMSFAQNQMPVNGKFELIPLPYPANALEPSIGRETMEIHWGKHVQTYIDNVNRMIQGTNDERKSLEEIVKNSKDGLYNNAAQVWNHNFFFSIMSPNPQRNPTGKLSEEINKSFGSLNNFKKEFAEAASSLFGSGWVWLVKKNNGSLEIKSTPNGDNPIKDGTPVIGLDVWEHAFYLDYKNKKKDYIDAFWNVLDWKKVEEYYNR